VIFNAPTLAAGGPARVLVLRKWFKCLLQMTGPGTIFLGTSKDEAGRTTNLETQDGIQINNAIAGPPNPPFYIWWKGEMWAAASIANANFVIVVPGLSPSEFEVTGADECNPEYSFVED